jgi:hypothetical protein
MKKVKVEFIAENQCQIYTEDGVYFQSYNSTIAFRPYDRYKKTVLDSAKWDYSKTTGKYRNHFLGDGSKAITEKKIKEGIYELADLNK